MFVDKNKDRSNVKYHYDFQQLFEDDNTAQIPLSSATRMRSKQSDEILLLFQIFHKHQSHNTSNKGS